MTTDLFGEMVLDQSHMFSIDLEFNRMCLYDCKQWNTVKNSHQRMIDVCMTSRYNFRHKVKVLELKKSLFHAQIRHEPSHKPLIYTVTLEAAQPEIYYRWSDIQIK